MKKLISLFAVIAAVAVLYSSTGCSDSDKPPTNDSLDVSVVFTDVGDGSVYTYECKQGDTVRVDCPNGSSYSYVVCEEGETVPIACSDSDTIHIAVYNPLNPGHIDYVLSDTVH